MKKLLVFLDELYYFNGEEYISTYSSGTFLQQCLSSVEYLIPIAKNKEIPQIYSTEIANNTKVYELPYWTSVVSFFNYYLKKKSNREQIKQVFLLAIKNNDLIFIRMPSYPGIILAKLALKNNKKVIIHYAGDISEAWKHDKYKGIKKLPAYMISKYMESQEKKLSKNKNVINLCTGSLLFDKYRKYGKSIFFIDSMINKKKLSSHNIDIDKKRFIYIGRFTEDKGIILLLNVILKISQKYPNFSLDIIGFGAEEEKVIKLSQIIKQVNFIGFVPNQDIHKYLKKNDILIMPSTLSEGFPRVILEAWAKGLVVVSSDVGGIKGLGKDGKNIIFCEKNSFESLYEKVELIMTDKINLQKMQDYIIQNRDDITFEYYKNILEKTIREF